MVSIIFVLTVIVKPCILAQMKVFNGAATLEKTHNT